MLASFDTFPLRMNVIVAYAPHAGKKKNEKMRFYKELNDVFDSIPSHEISFLLGDFMEQLPREIDIFGPYIFREDNSTIEQLSEQQQENRQYFAELCQERRLVVVNTMFQKDSARLITYKNAITSNFTTPYATDRFAQTDYVCINQPWKNSITNAETTLQHSITSSHKLLISSLTTKLARKGRSIQDKPQTYSAQSNEQLLKYNQLVSAAYEDQQLSASEDPFEAWASILQDAAAKSFTPVPVNKTTVYF